MYQPPPLQGRSLLAGVNALYRAHETRRPPAERVLVDPFADPFVERDWRIQLIRYGRLVVFPLWRVVDQLQTVHVIRHRTVDELLLGRIDEGGLEQVLVVGAGYDTRPLRFADRIDGIRWFELDHPGTQQAKLAKLAGDPRWGRVRAGGIDLMTGSLPDTLGELGVASERPTCVVIEGVLHYLGAERAAAVLAELAAYFHHATLLLSFIRTEVYAQASGMLVRLIKTVREVPRLHFTPDELAALGRRCGWELVQRWTVEEQIASFAPQARTRSIGPSQDVALLRRAPRS